MAKKRKQPPPQQQHAESDQDGGDASVDQQSDNASAVSSEEEPPSASAPAPAPTHASLPTSDGRYHNKQRLLLVSSRGITARYRHLVEDLRQLAPHAKKESKLDVGKNYSGGGYGQAVNEIAEVRGCHSVMFLECRKRGQDGYLWLGRTGSSGGGGVGNDGSNKQLMTSGGPSVKFHITNIHTMDELKLTGNCMAGSRPILSFDSQFSSEEPHLAHLQIIKHLFVDVFGTPRGHPKSKPFVDRVMAFYYADGKVSRASRASNAKVNGARAIWVRNYQILEQSATTAKEAHNQRKLTGQSSTTSLIEIGPRFVLNPIRIFRGSFGGQTLYVNDEFVNPNVVRAMEKKEQGERYLKRKGAERKRVRYGEELKRSVPVDPLGDVFK
ncbi:hypothetical protein ACHAWO_007081 [Cyclotella atomus]|uniref:Brix domain-containing protein n=1 Tax=Cyclotella atomus TaxID=382360 RepID=A0ABD3QL45_9STRA